MLTITQAETEDHRRQAREILCEYLMWGCSLLERDFGIRPDIKALPDQVLLDLQKFVPSHGRLLLAFRDQELAGCVCLHTIGVDVGEIKRMYVRPQHRGQGVGRALVNAIIEEAREIGYTTLRLDSPPFSQAAHALYYTVGFRSIAMYPESGLPEVFHERWHFMELSLIDDMSAEGRCNKAPG